MNRINISACAKCPSLRGRNGSHVIGDYNIYPNTSVLVILSYLPNDLSTDSLGSSAKITQIKEWINNYYPGVEVGFTSVVKCHCGDGEKKSSTISACFNAHFTKLMQRFRPSKFLVMGSGAYKSFVGKVVPQMGIRQRNKYGDYVYTNSFEHVIDDEQAREKFFQHIRALFENVGYQNNKSKFEVNVVSTVKEAYEVSKYLLDAKLLAVDIEGSALPFQPNSAGNHVMCTSFTRKDNEAFVFPMDSLIKIWTPGEYQYIRELLKTLLQSKIEKIFHNGKYDILFLWLAAELVTANFRYDTMVWSYIVDERPPHDLKELVGTHYPEMLGYDNVLDTYISDKPKCKPKSGGSYYYIPNNILFPYCGLDTIATLKEYNYFKPIIDANPQWVYNYYKILLPVLKKYIKIESAGAKVDVQRISAYGAECQKLITSNTKFIMSELLKNKLPVNVNLNSPTEVADTLIALDIAKKEDFKTTKDGKLSCDEQDLIQYINAGSKVAIAINSMKKAAKLKGTYVDGYLSKTDKRGFVHSNYNITLTSTGRPSSSNPNMQNVSPKVKKFYIPSTPDSLIVEFDWSQLELRLMACMSLDPTMILLYKMGEDLHKLTAAGSKKVITIHEMKELVDKREIELLVKKLIGGFNGFEKELGKKFRQYAKSTNFHLNYGGVANSLITRINVDIEKAKREKSILYYDTEDLEIRTKLKADLKILEDSKIKVKCNGCGYFQTEPMSGRYENGRYVYECPECGGSNIYSEAQEFYDAYFLLYPKVKEYHTYVEEFVTEHGYIDSPYGCRRHFPDAKSDNKWKRIKVYNEAKNHPIQSAGGYMKYEAITRIDNAYVKFKIRSNIINEVHDSIVQNVLIRELFTVLEITRESMENFNYDWVKTPMKSDMKIGLNWGNMTEVKNEAELMEWAEKNKIKLQRP